jgi:Domain of unknown function (DUF1707)
MTAPRMRAGTADRQAAVDGLTRHFTEGRLDAGEFDERVGRAYAATHLDELPELFVDLPDDQQRGRYGPAVRRPDAQEPASYGPAGRPISWSGPPGPRLHRPPRFLAVFVLVALVFSIAALANGVFPFPLIWIALVLLFITRGPRQHHPAWQHHRQNYR